MVLPPLFVSTLLTVKKLISTIDPELAVTPPVPKGPLIRLPEAPFEFAPAVNFPPETVVPPE